MRTESRRVPKVSLACSKIGIINSDDFSRCVYKADEVVGCTHDGRQQLKQIANLAAILLYQEEEEETLFNNITLIIGPT